MNKSLPHDSFCRDVLSDVSTFLELVDYLASQNADLRVIINLLDLSTLERIPGDFSDTARTGYADLAFRANVKKEYLRGDSPVQVCVGFLVEHKSYMDDDVLEQLRKYHYHLMVEKLKKNAVKGIPSIAIILYNGKENWNPLENLDYYPNVLRDIVLPFKGVFVDVDDVDDETCLEKFSPRLGAFIISLKYARDVDAHKDVFKKIIERLDMKRDLDLCTSMDVYLNGWLSRNFEEDFYMDFVRPPYETIADAQRKRRETLEKKLADKDAENASLIAENAAKDARIKELEAALAAK